MMCRAATGPCWSSRPVVRKMNLRFLPSVIWGTVADGVTITMPSFSYISDAGIVDPEHRWPITYLMRWLTILLATATACLGSQASSIMTASSFLPPPAPPALICSMPVSPPALTIPPYGATEPLMGPAMAIWTVCACADKPKMASMDAAAIEWMRMDDCMVLVWMPPGGGQDPRRVVKKSAATLYPALRADGLGFSAIARRPRYRRLTSA